MGLPIGAQPQKIEDTKIEIPASEMGVDINKDDLETMKQACKNYLKKHLPHATYKSFFPVYGGKIEIRIDVILGGNK